jgi:hypothetical protein
MRRSHWYASLAGILALFVAAAIALGLQLGASGSPQPRSTPAAADGCRGNLPARWQDALRAAVVALAQPAEPLAVDADGVLYARTADATIIAIDKQRSVRTVYHLPAGTAADATIRLYPAAGRLVVATLDAAGDRLSRLDVVDAGSGHARRIPVTGTSDGAAVQDGILYWDERPDADDPGGIVRRYDVATGRTTIADYGQVSAPTATVAGVSWGSGTARATLPAKLAAALPPDASVVTDGTAYAWSTGGTLHWADRGGDVRGPITQHVAATPQPQAVAGDVVLFSPHAASGELYLLDVRSGKVADTGLQATGIALSGGGVLALGGPLAGTTGTPPLLQLDTGGLPALGC